MVKPAALTLPRTRVRPWPAVALGALLVVALVTRLVNLDAYTGKFDEGIRVEQLLLMSAGFRPVRDIFAGQGPLSLDVFYGPYLLFGQTLAAARAAVVIYSLLGLLAAFWTARLLAGRLAGLLAVLLLVLSPLYLKNSRLALLEVPALAPATLALGAALLYQRDGQRRWLALAAVAFAVALLVKPLVVGVAVPIGLALLLRPRWRRSDLLLFGAIVGLAVALVVALYGPEQVWQQMVEYRARARQVADWSLKENWSIMRPELRDEGLPLYGLAVVGGLFLAIRHPRRGLPLAAWPLVNLGLLLAYTPLQFKHLVILLPPIALVIGTAGGMTVSGSRFQVSGFTRTNLKPETWNLKLLRGVPLVVLCAWYATALPAILREDWQIVGTMTESRVETYADETALLPRLAGPDEFVIVDDPIVAYNSRRKVPPGLVDTSSYLIRSGVLSGTEVIAAAERYDVKVLLLFSDGLRDIQAFEDYVDGRYRAVRIYERQNGKDRAIYLRDDADFEAARAALAAEIAHPLRADFGGDLRLLGYNLGRDDPRAGSSTTLTLHWEALRPMAADYHVVTHLRGPGGEPDVQSERGLGGGGEGTASWEAGRWVIRTQTLVVPSKTPPGEYQLSVALYDSENKVTPPLTAGGAAGQTEVPLGRLRVR